MEKQCKKGKCPEKYTLQNVHKFLHNFKQFSTTQCIENSLCFFEFAKLDFHMQFTRFINNLININNSLQKRFLNNIEVGTFNFYLIKKFQKYIIIKIKLL